NWSPSARVWAPKRRARPSWPRRSTCTTSVAAEKAARYVRFGFDNQTPKRGGSMLHRVAKATRHPSRSDPVVVVTIPTVLEVGVMGVMHRLLARNDEFVSKFRHRGRTGAPARHPAPLPCIESGIHLAPALGLDIGDANIIRNAGGRASDDAIRSLVISTELLGTNEIAVMHHTDCGMLKFTNDDLRTKLSSERGVDASGVDFLPFPE